MRLNKRVDVLARFCDFNDYGMKISEIKLKDYYEPSLYSLFSVRTTVYNY
jgi:hypothetical protein